MSLRLSAVSLTYSGASVPALNEVSMELAAGELLVVAGPNGSGKTSLLRVLGQAINHDRGTVTLDGQSPARWRRREWAQLVGLLPQREEPAFAMSVRESVWLGRWAHLGPVASPGAADHRAVDNAVKQCGLEPFLDRSIDSLSGGEWQRARLARALAAEPKYLLLDEPSSALDLSYEMTLYELLRELVGGGLGVLSVTHHLNVASRYANRLALMKHGQIVSQGAVTEVLTAAITSAVYQWPVTIQEWRAGEPQVIPLRRDEA